MPKSSTLGVSPVGDCARKMFSGFALGVLLLKPSKALLRRMNVPETAAHG